MIHLLTAETAAAIRYDNARFRRRLARCLQRYTSVDGYGFDVRQRAGHVTFTDKAEADDCAGLLRAASWTVEVQAFDWSDDPDFDHDHEWHITFKAD